MDKTLANSVIQLSSSNNLQKTRPQINSATRRYLIINAICSTEIE